MRGVLTHDDALRFQGVEGIGMGKAEVSHQIACCISAQPDPTILLSILSKGEELGHSQGGRTLDGILASVDLELRLGGLIEN